MMVVCGCLVKVFAVGLAVMALSKAVSGAPARPAASAALARVLVPVVRHRLEEGRALPPGLMEELVTDLEDSEPRLRHIQAIAGKREFDDYGHMRFGKRSGVADYDDYGHLRFGRSADGSFDDDEGKFNAQKRPSRHDTTNNPTRA